MTISELIGFVKIVATISTTGFGAVALLKENKNRSGKLTKWGRIALIGIFVSALTALVLQSLETNKAKSDALEAQKSANSTTQYLKKIIQTATTTERKQSEALVKTHAIADSMIREAEITKKIANNLGSSLKLQNESIEKLRGITKINLKQLYPMKPVHLTYEKEYDMNDPVLRDYCKELLRSENAIRHSALIGPNETYYMDSTSLFLPKKNEKAYEILMKESTYFTFSNRKNLKDDIRLWTSCSMFSEGGYSRRTYDYQLVVDFKRKKISKFITSAETLGDQDRSGIELAGRIMTWSDLETDYYKLHWQIVLIQFEFGYQANPNIGSISPGPALIESGQSNLHVEPENLGLPKGISQVFQ